MLRTTVLRLLGAVVLLCLIAPATAQTNYTKTRYPIVLVHGLLGFDALGGVYEYFYGIPSELTAGGATVFTPQVSASNSTTLRGEQLITELDNLRAVYGYTKFNLIGHSHGGPTIRYVASVRPDLVASITSLGGPNTGSKVADGVNTLAPPGSLQNTLAAGFVNALSKFIALLSSDAHPQDSLAALASLTTVGSAQFNALHPEGMPSVACGQGAAVVNGIRYYSMGGTSVLTNVFDVSDPLLAAGALFFGTEASDGLVGRCSSHLGVVLRDDYGWNHLDEVNQVLGLRGLFSSSPASVLRAQANRLKLAGL